MDELLFHDFESMRRFVGKLKGEESIRNYVRNLESPDVDDRRRAAGSLNYADPTDETVTSALRKALSDPDAEVRICAADSLAKLLPDNLESVPVLIDGLRFPDDLVRDASAHSIAELASLASEVSPGLANRLQAALPTLVVMLQDENPQIRYSASFTLRRFGTGAVEAIPALISALDDSNHVVRVNAVAAFYFTGPAARAVVPKLLAIFEDPKRTPRSTAAQALVSIAIDDPGIPDVIVRALNDPDYDVWQGTLISVTKLGERGVPLLIPALDGGYREAQEQIINSIGSFKQQARAAIPKLKAIANGTREDLREVAADALKKIEAGS